MFLTFYLLTSSQRNGSLRGIFVSHVLLKWYWSVCTQLKEEVYERHGGNVQKESAIHSGKWKSNLQVELTAMDLHIINLIGVFTPACYCSTTQHRLV